MAFLMSYDRDQMDEDAWKEFLKGKVIRVTGGRERSFNSTLIMNNVARKSGTNEGACNHYIPYSVLENAIENTLADKNLSEACEWLKNAVVLLYMNTYALVRLAQLHDSVPEPNLEDMSQHTAEKLAELKKERAQKWVQAPKKAFLDNFQRTFSRRTRVVLDVWTIWALEAICDYPNNLFYGSGSGDEQGTTLDIPTNANTSKYVRLGAQQLKEAIGKKLDIIDENGNLNENRIPENLGPPETLDKRSRPKPGDLADPNPEADDNDDNEDYVGSKRNSKKKDIGQKKDRGQEKAIGLKKDMDQKKDMVLLPGRRITRGYAKGMNQGYAQGFTR